MNGFKRQKQRFKHGHGHFAFGSLLLTITLTILWAQGKNEMTLASQEEINHSLDFRLWAPSRENPNQSDHETSPFKERAQPLIWKKSCKEQKESRFLQSLEERHQDLHLDPSDLVPSTGLVASLFLFWDLAGMRHRLSLRWQEESPLAYVLEHVQFSADQNSPLQPLPIPGYRGGKISLAQGRSLLHSLWEQAQAEGAAYHSRVVTLKVFRTIPESSDPIHWMTFRDLTPVAYKNGSVGCRRADSLTLCGCHERAKVYF